MSLINCWIFIRVKQIRKIVREVLFEIFDNNRINISIEDVYNLIDFHNSFRDLYPGYSDEENEYEEDYYYPSKEGAQSHVGDVINLFEDMPNPIPVYRSIKVKSIDDIDYDLLGDSWSFDRQSAINFAKNQAGGDVLISGFVRKENVDWEDTIKHYFEFSETFSDYDENEIKIPNAEDDVFNIKAEKI